MRMDLGQDYDYEMLREKSYMRYIYPSILPTPLIVRCNNGCLVLLKVTDSDTSTSKLLKSQRRAKGMAKI